jgi:hypothetical protein
MVNPHIRAMLAIIHDAVGDDLRSLGGPEIPDNAKTPHVVSYNRGFMNALSYNPGFMNVVS